MTQKHAGKMLFLCFSTYLTVYMLRVNFSSAITPIAEQLSVSEDRLGMAGAAFFITYAFGQLINGFISDAVSPFKFIVFAMTGSVLSNFLLSCSPNFWMILLFWAVNGYFQSIFWAALTRILSFCYGKEKHSMVATTMSASMVGGFIMTWVVLGRLLQGAQWRAFFFVPAVWGVVMLVIWLIVGFKMRKMPIPCAKLSAENLKRTLHFIVEKKLYFVCLICTCMSFVKESISVWGPTILAKMLDAHVHSSALVLFMIPIGNLCGMFFAKFLIDRFRGNEIRTLMVLFLSIFLSAAVLLLFREQVLLVTVAMIVLISALSFGCNSILLSFIPLAYTKYNLVSTLVGIFDFSSYIGAAASSLIIGAVIASGSWTRIIPLWTVLPLLALFFCFVAKKKTQLL